MKRGFYRYRYGARDEHGQFLECGRSNSEGYVMAISDAENYEVQKHIPQIKVGSKIVNPKWIVVKQQTNQMRLI